MSIPSNPTPLAGVIGASADVLPIPAQDYTDPTQNGALNYATGWPAITSLPLEAGGKAPRREYFNALTQLMSSHIFFQQSGSLYTWSATLDYLTGAHVLGSDGKEYIAQKSNGPDVPDSSAIDPVGDDSGTWLSAISVYTATIQTEVQSLNKDWIGVPRPWRSTTLPPNHCWANGDFVAFADWPELKAVYEAGGFGGMLLPWDADSSTQAANLGQWRPDAAQPTGLYTPNLTGQFLRCWGQGASEGAGAWGTDTGRNVTGSIVLGTKSGAIGTYQTNGAIGNFSSSNVLSGGGSAVYANYGFTFDASRVWTAEHTGTEFAPRHIWQPIIIYLGQPAKEAA